MKVIFNCAYFEFHKQFCFNIKNYLEANGHIAIITESRKNNQSSNVAINIENYYITAHGDADFTILPDESCRIIGGKGIYINHALLPNIPENNKFETKMNWYFSKNFHIKLHQLDYLFLPSQTIAEVFKKQLNIQTPIKICWLSKIRQYNNSKKKEKNK